MDEFCIRSREVRGKPGKFIATEANETGNMKKIDNEECQSH